MDERLRELGRRARESGDPQLEARWLAERLRTGDLDPARLRLSRSLRHPASLLVQAAGPPPSHWVTALSNPDAASAGRRAALALARAALEECPGTPVYAPLRAVLDRVEAWVGCPCAGCGEAVEDEVSQAYARAQDYVWDTQVRSWGVAWDEPHVRAAPRTGAALVREYFREETDAELRAAQHRAWDVVLGLARVASLSGDPVRATHAEAGLREVLRVGASACGRDEDALAVIRAEVVPWLLG